MPAISRAMQQDKCNKLVETLGSSILKGESTFTGMLRAAATSQHADVREHAMLALGGASPTEKPPPFMNILTKGLADPVDKVDKAAAKALVRLGPAAMASLEE